VLIVLLGAETRSSGASDDPIIPPRFLGDWSGHLPIHHSPFSPAEASQIHYRLEISTDIIRLFVAENEQQLLEDPYVSSSMDTHLLVVISKLGPTWTEDYSINLIWLGENRVYAYVSRVVSNFSLSQDDHRRHYPIFLSGELVKNST
jgi:hypothetical protein